MLVADPGTALLALAAALLLDLLLGEPPNAVHPVAWMGRTVAVLERAAPRSGAGGQFLWGLAVALLVPAVFAVAAAGLVALLGPWPLAGSAAEALLLKTTFAVRALGQAAADVRTRLEEGDLPGARAALRSLCNRDASDLDEPGLVSATVESVAENASDSAVAPFLWYALLGLPGAMAYRAINTLDGTIGFRGRYEWLGKCSARLDDLANLVPARLTAALLVISSPVLRGNTTDGIRVWWRDSGLTASPNAGRPMAAMAGFLGVQLEKRGHYRLGDASQALGPGKIREAWRLARTACLLAATLAAATLGGAHVLR